MRRSLLLAAFASLLAFSAPSFAAGCPGVAPWVFDDIDDTDPFCPYITYMAQQGISLGCAIIDANHRLFCPNDTVTRKQMAAFMSRLGNISVPVYKRWGNFVATINGGATQYVFAGNWATVSVPTGQTRRVTASASASMGLLGIPVPIGGNIALCWQKGTDPLNTFNSQSQTVLFSETRTNYAVSDSDVLFEGDYKIGMCVLNPSVSPIANNDMVQGWLILSN